MKPFSPLLYLKHNFKSVLPIFISIAVGVFLVYFYTLFSATTIKMTDATMFNLMKKYNIAYTNDSKPLPASFLNKLRETDGDAVIAVQLNPPGLQYSSGGMGSSQIQTFNIFSEDTARLLKNCGVRLVEGTLPRDNQNEILVPRKFALQNHVGVGDPVGSEVSDIYTLPGKYKIRGLTEGPVLFAIVCQPKNATKEQIMKHGVIYPVNHLNSDTQKNLLNSLPADVVYHTYSTSKQELAATLATMQSLTYFLAGMMIIILCIALGNLNAILFANRKGELSILNAIGYTKGNLSLKLWKENALICFAGYLAGIGLAELVAWLLNNGVLYLQGKELTLMSLSGMIAALAMPVFVSIFSLLPCLLQNYRNLQIS